MTLISGCTSNKPKISLSPIDIMLSETVPVEIEILNAGGIAQTELKGIMIESLTDTKGIVSFNPSKTTIEKPDLKKGESTKAKIYLTGEKHGSTVASLKLRYNGGSKNFQIPITVNKPSLSLFLQDYSTGTLEIGTPEQIYLLITNRDDVTYSYGKIEIITREPDVELKTTGGFTFLSIDNGIEVSNFIQPGSLRVPLIVTASLPEGREALEFKIKVRLLWSSLGDNYKLIQEKEVPIRVERK